MLSFVNKFSPQTINKHSERKTTPTKKNYFPNTVSRKEVLRRMNTGLLSPSTKRKGEGGIWAELYSPGKRQKNVKTTLNYWEDKLINSKLISESDILAKPYDETSLVLDEDNGSGGSGVNEAQI